MSLPPNQTRVLVADDDPVMLRVLTLWLKSEGYQVTTAGDGHAARQAIQENCPHCLITDWEMPLGSGVELCKWIRSQNLPNYIYLLFITGREDQADLIQALEAGADDFLRKPVNWTELKARLKSATRILSLQHRLSQLANQDPLTGLVVQRTFFQQMEAEWSRSQRHGTPLSVAMIDVDFFKRVNDTYGHAAGDEVLRTVAQTMQQNCRDTDLMCRYGGEEFAAMLPETDETAAAVWADGLRRTLESTPVKIDGREISLTASLGVSQRTIATNGPSELVDQADQALLVAKRSGRNTVTRFSSLADTGAGPSGNASEPMQGLFARDVMIAIVAKLRKSTTLGRAADEFLHYRINSAPVIDGAGRLCGIVSEREVVTAMTWPNWRESPVGEIMNQTIVTFEEDTPVTVVYDFLCRVSVRSVIVVNDGRPVGAITRSALVRLFQNSTLLAAIRPVEFVATSGGGRGDLQTAAARITSESTRLVTALAPDGDDPLPCTIASASRMQELIGDLLGCLRRLQSPEVAHAAEVEMTQTGLAGMLDLIEAEDNT